MVNVMPVDGMAVDGPRREAGHRGEARSDGEWAVGPGRAAVTVLGPPMADLLVHEALRYADESELVEVLVPFVREALAAGEPVLVALPAAGRRVLADALGGIPAEVRFVDIAEAGRNPGRILPGILHAFTTEHPGRRVRIAVEPVWPGRSGTAYPACVQHEALTNLALAGQPVWILCVYDAGRLAPTWLADAASTHRTLVSTTGRRPSPDYREPAEVVDAFNAPLPAPPPEAEEVVFGADTLPGLRQLVYHYAATAGLGPDLAADLRVAVNEVATNAVTHGQGPAVVRLWPDEDGVVCEIADAGVLTDRLAGRLPPAEGSECGRGLLLVNLLCDLVRIHAGPAGTTVRLHLYRR